MDTSEDISQTHCEIIDNLDQINIENSRPGGKKPRKKKFVKNIGNNSKKFFYKGGNKKKKLSGKKKKSSATKNKNKKKSRKSSKKNSGPYLKNIELSLIYKYIPQETLTKAISKYLSSIKANCN